MPIPSGRLQVSVPEAARTNARKPLPSVRTRTGRACELLPTTRITDVFRSLAWFTYERLLGSLLLLTVVLACALTPMQTDTWWQLRAGHDMWASGRVLLTDLYSHTAYGSFWPNHEWLAEVTYYAAYRVGGLPLVTLLAAALISGGWALVWRLTQGPSRVAFAWTASALIPACLWWEPRPHAFSLLLLPASVYLLVRNRLTWLPLVFLVWANCHGGVLLGLVVLAAGLAARTLQAPSTWTRTSVVFGGCLLAATATPLGLSFWTEIPRSLQRIHLYPLDEWRRTPVLEAQLLPFWAIATAFTAALARAWRHPARRQALLARADLPLQACATVLLPMAAMAIRHVGPFLMLAVPALTSCMDVSRGPSSIPAPRPAAERHRLNFSVSFAATVAVALTILLAYWNEIDRLRWTPIPAPALAALRTCPGNLYNRYDEGGSLIWFAPQHKVFLDGRQDPYPPELVLEHIQIETTGADHSRLFARHDIRCAYLPVTSPTAVRLAATGWTTLYRDGDWAVFSDRPPAVTLPVAPGRQEGPALSTQRRRKSWSCTSGTGRRAGSDCGATVCRRGGPSTRGRPAAAGRGRKALDGLIHRTRAGAAGIAAGAAPFGRRAEGRLLGRGPDGKDRQHPLELVSLTPGTAGLQRAVHQRLEPVSALPAFVLVDGHTAFYLRPPVARSCSAVTNRGAMSTGTGCSRSSTAWTAGRTPPSRASRSVAFA